jgi:hypothetical protein
MKVTKGAPEFADLDYTPPQGGKGGLGADMLAIIEKYRNASKR